MSSQTTNQEIISHSKQQLRILNKFRTRLEKEKYINNYASNYYSNMHNRFSIPGIIVSGVSSIASFLATSTMMSDTGKTAISIGVGILAAGSTIIYSIANSYGFQTRRDAFQISADAYDDLITRIEFEIVNPNENFNEFCNSLEAQILKIKTDCKYLPPLFIYKMYEEETRKMKLQGLYEEHDASLDFVMIDNSPTQTKVLSTTNQTSSSNTNKQIKLPEPSIANIEPIDSLLKNKTVKYFNDLTNVGSHTGTTTVNKLSTGGLTISNLDIPIITETNTDTEQLIRNETLSTTINMVNIDGVNIVDGTISI